LEKTEKEWLNTIVLFFMNIAWCSKKQRPLALRTPIKVSMRVELADCLLKRVKRPGCGGMPGQGRSAVRMKGLKGNQFGTGTVR
jgi:hypothetical protein